MKFDLYQQITDKIIEQLEAGTAPWFKPWKTGGLGMRPLRANGEHYRGINTLLLWSVAAERGYSSPYWMTYKQAQELGAHVRKGETGSTVVYAGNIPRSETDESGEEREFSIPFLKQYKVFNVEQIEELPRQFTMPAPKWGNEIERIAQVEQFFEQTGAHISHGGDRAFYAPQLDGIRMPEIERFKDAESYYSTLAHECIHWTGHESRLNRKFDGSRRFGGEAYAMEELVAEMGAAFLASDLGLYAEPREDHAAYLATWLKALKADKRTIFTAASHAEKATELLHSYQKEELAAAA